MKNIPVIEIIKMLGIFLVYISVCISIGLGCIRLLNKKLFEIPSFLILSLSLVLGQALLSQLWLGLALCGVFYRSVVLCLVSGFFLLGFVFWRSYFWRSLREILASFHQLFLELPSWAKILLFLVLIQGLLFLISAPITPIRDDAAAYYLAYPKFIASKGRILPMINGYFDFSQIGVIAEMNYAALILLGPYQNAQLLQWMMGLSSILMLLGIGSLCGLGKLGKLFLSALILTSSAFFIFWVDGKVDPFAEALGIASLWIALDYLQKKQMRNLVLAGLLAGFAFVAKISYVATLLPALFILILDLKKPKKIFWECLLLGCGICLGLFLHVIKNGILFSEPFVPFFLFNKKGPSVGLSQAWMSHADTIKLLKIYPLALFYGRFPLQGGGFSALVLGFFPLLVLSKFWKSSHFSFLLRALMAGLVGVTLWAIAEPSVMCPRYFWPVLALLAVPAAYGAEWVYLKSNSSRFLKWAIPICIVFFGINELVFNQAEIRPALQLLSGGPVGSCDPENTACRGYTQFINNKASLGDRVILYSYFTFWLRDDLFQCQYTAEDHPMMDNVGSNPAASWKALFRGGFKYLVVDQRTHSYMTKLLDPKTAPNWLAVKLLEDPDNGVGSKPGELLVYSIESKDPKKKSDYMCNLDKNGLYTVKRL